MKVWLVLVIVALGVAADARAVYLECATARFLDHLGEQKLVELQGERVDPIPRAGESQVLYRTAQQRRRNQPGILVTRRRTATQFEVEEYHGRTEGLHGYHGEPKPDFHALFDLRPDGRLTFSVKTSRSATDKSAFIHAAMELENALRFFGQRVKSVEGNWSEGSTNFEQFREALAQGQSIEEAALATWTGRQVSARGFTAARPTHSTQTVLDAGHPATELINPTFLFARPEPRVQRVTDTNSYQVREGDFFANFELVPGQPLRDMTRPNWTRDPSSPRTHLTYEARVADGTGRSSGGIELQAELKSALAHFGSRVEAIDAYFQRGSPEMTEYLAARAEGYTPKQAALRTWVGREAAARGLSVVEYGFETQAKLKVWGRNGEPESLAFRFRPPRR